MQREYKMVGKWTFSRHLAAGTKAGIEGSCDDPSVDRFPRKRMIPDLSAISNQSAGGMRQERNLVHRPEPDLRNASTRVRWAIRSSLLPLLSFRNRLAKEEAHESVPVRLFWMSRFGSPNRGSSGSVYGRRVRVSFRNRWIALFAISRGSSVPSATDATTNFMRWLWRS